MPTPGIIYLFYLEKKDEAKQCKVSIGVAWLLKIKLMPKLLRALREGQQERERKKQELKPRKCLFQFMAWRKLNQFDCLGSRWGSDKGRKVRTAAAGEEQRCVLQTANLWVQRRTKWGQELKEQVCIPRDGFCPDCSAKWEQKEK